MNERYGYQTAHGAWRCPLCPRMTFGRSIAACEGDRWLDDVDGGWIVNEDDDVPHHESVLRPLTLTSGDPMSTEAIAWLVQMNGGGTSRQQRWVTLDEARAAVYAEPPTDYTVTPLVAAPPAQTVEEVREMLHRYAGARVVAAGEAATLEVRLLSLLSCAAPATDGLEAAARLVENFAAKHYPPDVFTPDGTTVDAQSARAIRAVLPAIASDIRALAALPEGAPTYSELVEALRLYGDDSEYHIDVLGPCGIGADRDENGDFGARARALLSRIPTPENADASA